MTLPVRFYFGLLLRRLPVMTLFFLACSGVGLVTALQLPPTYSSSARLQVEAPQIPGNMVASIVQIDAGEQLQLIEEQLMTRANLIDIARKHNVFENLGEMTPDSIVDGMRQSTRIRRSVGRGQATLMSISFTARDGQLAANVVNDYVTIVLESNSASRRERAQGTLSFFEQETVRLERELLEQSSRIVAFKEENVGALPDDLRYRRGRQTALQERLSGLERDRAAIIAQRTEIIAVFEATGRLGGGGPAVAEATPEQARLERLELELDELLTIYSEINPRVTLLKSRIEQLRENIVNNAAESSEEAGDEEVSTDNAILDITLLDMDQRITQIDLEITAVNTELIRLAESISLTASNAIMLERLERDLENTRSRYNMIQNNLSQARMAERVEINAQGQRISLIEGANVPQNPSGPPRTKIAAAGVGGGAALALGYFILLELLNRTIRHPAELHSRFGITPIGVIPYMEAQRQRLWRRGLMIVTFLGVLLAVPAGLYVVHTQYMPLEILANRVFTLLMG